MVIFLESTWTKVHYLILLCWDCRGLHQGTHVRVTMELEDPKRSMKTLFMVMGQHVLWWESHNKFLHYKNWGTMIEKCRFDTLQSNFILLPYVYVVKRMLKGRSRERRWSMKIKYLNCLFGAYIKRNSTHSLFGAWSLLLVFTLDAGSNK